MSINNRNNSRFSTLKVFKFNKEKPPTPPPKDVQYFSQLHTGPYSSSKSLYNPSVTSLSPPTEPVPSLPPTPLIPDYSRASPSLSASSVRSFTPSSTLPMPVKPKRSIFKFSSLGKRMNRSARNLTDPEPEDEGISAPWNIQHHIHVDEGLSGFPPSWSTALSQAGFTDDEITAIYARRALTCPSDLAAESQESASHTSSPLSLLQHPVPRSSSLSNASYPARSSSTTLLASAYTISPSPTTSSFNLPPSRQSSCTATSSSHSNSVCNPDPGDTHYVFVNGAGHESMIDPYPLDAQSVSTHRSNSTHYANAPQILRTQSDTGDPSAWSNPTHVTSPLGQALSLPSSHHSVRNALPRTPPRRVFHVANASDESPPPAYSSPDRGPGFLREKFEMSSSDGQKIGTRAPERAGKQVQDDGEDGNSVLDISATADMTCSSLYTDFSLPLPSMDIDPAILNRHLSPTPPLIIDKRLTKMNALPPRLSFHFSSDLGLGDWGAGFGLEEDGRGSRLASGGGSRSENSSASLGNGGFASGSKIASTSKDPQRNSREADRGEGCSSLFPGFSQSSSTRSPSPSTWSFTPSTPTSSKSHSPSTSTSTPSTSPSPSHSPSESGMLSPTLPDVSFGANITFGAPLRVMGSLPTRSVSPAPTRNVPPTPLDKISPTSHHTIAEDDREMDEDSPILPDVSLGPNVSSLGAGLLSSGPDVSTETATTEELAELASSLSASAGESMLVPSPERLLSTISAEKFPAVDSALSSPITDRRPGSDVPVSLQPEVVSSVTGESLAPSTLLPARPAGDRDSGLSTMTVTPARIVNVSGAMAITRARASVVDSDSMSEFAVESPRDDIRSETNGGVLESNPSWPEPSPTDVETTPRQPTRLRSTSSIQAQGSPHSSHFSSDTSSTADSAPLVTPEPSLLPQSALRVKSFSPDVAFLTSLTNTFGGRESDSEDDYIPTAAPKAHSQSQRYPAWIVKAVAPLSEFIVNVDPEEYFADLQEIAEGESGSVYAVRVVCPLEELSLPAGTTHVAVKAIALQPSMSLKLQDLRNEMELMRGVHHEHVLRMDAFYVNLVDDSLWIRMELMERSLADVIGLVCEGLSLQERMIARFASDVLLALEYLQKHHIGHRDVRSDNLLLNASGILKIADFSNAVRVTRNAPMCVGAVGVIYWQAPEMRVGAYNTLKVDVWSLGATVWELAQTEPPFADVQDPRQIGSQWPPLRHPELYSRNFHEFLRLCSRPSASRPNANELLNTPFIRNACGRAVNVQLLSQCRSIEEHVLQRENAGDS